jgi:hypothetical protein
VNREFDTVSHEYHYISREIKEKLMPERIPRNCSDCKKNTGNLKTLVPYLKGAGIENIKYEREQNVFKEPHVSQLVILARFLNSLADKHHDEADEFLPEILSFPFWEIKREDVWKISIDSRRGEFSKSWLETMKESKEKKIRDTCFSY